MTTLLAASRRRRPAFALGLALALGGLLAACSSGASGPTGTSGTTSSSAPATTAPVGSTSPSTTAAGSSTTSTTLADASACGPEGLTDSPTSVPFGGVQFVGADGWVVGDGHILATVDGGANWTTQWQGAGPLESVDFVNASDGWAVGIGVFLGTTNGGASWHSLPEPSGITSASTTAPGLQSVHFSSPTDGLGVAGGIAFGAGFTPACKGVLVSTSDGGESWSAASGTPPNVQSACSSGPANTWIAATVAGHPQLFIRSSSGSGWTSAFTPPVSRDAATVWAQLECSDNGVWAYFTDGRAAMNRSGYFAYRVTSSSATPLFEESVIESTVLPKGIPNGPGHEPGPFSAVSDTLAVFSGFTPTTAGGAPLDSVTPGEAPAALGSFSKIWDPVALSFSNADDGWAVGQGLSQGGGEVPWFIEATSDGGHHWSVQLSQYAK